MTADNLHIDNDLLQEIAQGSESAFRQLYDTYHQRIYSFALFLTRSDILAEEITQEIFIKIWTRQAELAEINNFNAWIKVVVRNHTFTYLTALAKENLALKNLGRSTTDATNDAETGIIDKEYSQLLTKAIEQLPPQQKKVYLLSRQQGLKQQEIAEDMGLSIQTVKNHMKAALKNIKLFIKVRTDVMISIALAIFFSE